MACTCRNTPIWATLLRPLTARAPLIQPANARLSTRLISSSLPRSSSDPTEPPKRPSVPATSPSKPRSNPKKPPRHNNHRRRLTSPAEPSAAAADSEPGTTGPDKQQPWQAQKAALAEKFPMGWSPPKRLSPDCLAGMRALHAQFPDAYDTPALANLFAVSPEAVRRILKSKWTPRDDAEEEERRQRWTRRGVRVWERYADLGLKVPSKWRREGVGKKKRGDALGGGGGGHRGGDDDGPAAVGVGGFDGTDFAVDGEALDAAARELEGEVEERKALEKVRARRRLSGKII